METQQDATYRTFEQHLAKGAVGSAVSMAEEMHSRSPQGELANVALARVKLNQQQPAAAALLLEALRPQQNHLPHALAWLAVAQLALGQADKAAQHAAAAVGLRPELGAAQRVLGQCCNLQGKHADALAWFKAVLVHEPADADAWEGLASSLRQMGKTAAGSQALRHVVALRPKEPKVHVELVRALLAAGQPQEAHAALLEGLKRWPREGELLRQADRVRQALTTTRGELAAQVAQWRHALLVGKTQEAAVAVAALARTHPKSRAITLLAAEVSLATHTPGPQQPVVALNALFKEHPDAWEARMLLAQAYLLPGHFASPKLASEHAEGAFAMSGGDARAGLTLVQAYLKAGRAPLAQAVAAQLRQLGAEVQQAVDRVLKP